MARSSIVRVACSAVVSLSFMLTAGSPADGLAHPSTAPAGRAADAADRAVARLRDDAVHPPRIVRDPGGVVRLVGTRSGAPVVPGEGALPPVSAARAHLARYSPAFGVSASDLSVGGVHTSGTGGSVVRLRQQVEDVPVVGGDLVVSLDADGGLLSVAGETSSAERAAEPVVTEERARQVAARASARAHDVGPDRLTTRSLGRWLYDPELLGSPDGLGPRTVWRFETGDGHGVRDVVLVDAASGRVTLRVDTVAEALDRYVCDNENYRASSANSSCYHYPARTETQPPTGVAELDTAFDLLGATAEMYAAVGDLDLNTLIGRSVSGAPKLTATVRYCEGSTASPCPLPNAFWNGTQVYLGDGFARADDVVAHELTHGVIERYSDLFYFGQSGAINESIADIMGEVLDRRNLTAADAGDGWGLGEDLPGGPLRDLADPTRHGQPDRMTSSLYQADPGLLDNGGVHTNSGVGNKTAYLISQGGTLGGVSVAGIDEGDPFLTKTATLYLDVLTRLSSGSDYADLARVLAQTCGELSATGAAGFSAADCESVAAATAATQLTSDPTVPGAGPAPDAPASCPVGRTKEVLFADGDFGTGRYSRPAPTLWTRAPDGEYGVPRNARTGRGSWFGFNPDPETYGDPASSTLTPLDGVAVPEGQPTYLRFSQWRLFDWTPGDPPVYHDGGTVALGVLDPVIQGYRDTSVAALPWENGPTDALVLSGTSPRPGWGGDSHGWTSSRLDLSSFGGRTVRPIWAVRGDARGSMLGWFLDDIEIYTCPWAAPEAPRGLSATARALAVDLTWEAASGAVDGYRVTRSDGSVLTAPGSATAATFRGQRRGTAYRYTVVAVGPGGTSSAAVSRTVHGSLVTAKARSVRVNGRARTQVTGRLTDTSGAGRARRYVEVQVRPATGRGFRAVARVRTGADGTFRYRFGRLERRLLRVAYPGDASHLAGLSPSRRLPR